MKKKIINTRKNFIQICKTSKLKIFKIKITLKDSVIVIVYTNNCHKITTQFDCVKYLV